MTKQIKLSGKVALRAAQADGPRKLRLEAYSGAPMVVSGFGLIVVDLAGLESDQSIPILCDHANEVGAVVGSGIPANDGKSLAVDVTVANCEAGLEVVQLLEAGVGLKASIGADPLERTFISAGKEISVNGRKIEAPQTGLTLISKAKLQEVSVVPIPADPNTSVKITAMKGTVMNPTFEQYVSDLGFDINTITPEAKDALKRAYDAQNVEESDELDTPANAARVVELLAANDAGHLATRAVSERWTMDRARQEALNSIRASRSSHTPRFVAADKHKTGSTMDQLSAALMVRAGLEDAAVRSYGEHIVEASKGFHRSSFPDIIRAALVSSGKAAPRDQSELIRAAFSGADITNMLSTVGNKIAFDVWTYAQPTWKSFCSIKSCRDFKTNTGLRASFGGDLSLVPEGGDIDHGQLGEEVYNWRVATYAKVYAVTRQTIFNDDLGLLSDLIPGMTLAAMRTLSNMVYATLMENGGSNFSAGNKNLQTPSALTPTTLGTAIALIRKQTDKDGNVLDIRPTTLLVPSSLEGSARQVLNSANIARSTATDSQLPTANPWQGAANLEVESRLEVGVTNPASKVKSTGSASTWYLFGPVSSAPMVVGFLNGAQAPTVESWGFDSDPDRLGMRFRCYHDFGVSFGDPRASVKST